MIPLPTWMRGALFATAGMNILASAAFIPAAESLRVVAGLPEAGQPLYLVMVGVFVLTFGLAYLWAAMAGQAERLFIAVAATGKLSFFGLLVWFWAVGDLPVRAPVLGTGDLVFAVLFLVWLFRCAAVLPGTAPKRTKGAPHDPDPARSALPLRR
jgi:hypothetical protein